MARDCFPSQLSSYLYELSRRFMFFYENCPIMMPGVAPHLRISRLTLAYLTLQTLRTGLDLLGVEAPSRM